MQVNKDERALQDVIMHDKLSAMSIAIDNEEENVTHALSDDLQNILEDDSDSEVLLNYTLTTDSSIDAYRLNSGSR